MSTPKLPAKVVARSLFDERPINLGGFELRGREALPIDRPTLDGWRLAFEYASATEESSPYWVGDLLAYADDREDWRQRLDQAKSVTRLAHQTLLNRTSLSRKVRGRARELAPSISHADAVKSLPADEQEELLEQAQAEEWTVAELERAKKDRDRRTVVAGQAAEMHTIEVTVRMTREAASPYLAEQAAWAAVRSAIAGMAHAHVIAAHARPYIQAVRPPRKKTA